MNRGKSRTSGIHRASSGYANNPTNPVPLNTTSGHFNVPTQSAVYPTSHSSGPGMFYSPEAFMQPSNEKSHYQYTVSYDNNPQTQPWALDPPIFNANSAPPNYHPSGIYHPHPVSFSPQPTGYAEPTIPLQVPDSHPRTTLFPNNVGSPIRQGKESHPMDIEEKPGDGEASPPMTPSSVADNAYMDAGTSQSAPDKRPRDKHRKEIENRAAEKRKSAVKKLQRVLSIRTQGLPENGLANQLHMAADQLEEDGRTINQLKHDNKILKKKNEDLQKSVASLEVENSTLKNEVQVLKRSA